MYLLGDIHGKFNEISYFAQKNIEKEAESAIYYNPPVQIRPQIQMRNTSNARIPRIGITPNPRTIYRHH
jgi:hypothetical protein